MHSQLHLIWLLQLFVAFHLRTQEQPNDYLTVTHNSRPWCQRPGSGGDHPPTSSLVLTSCCYAVCR
jgi:hypothetical protein